MIFKRIRYFDIHYLNTLIYLWRLTSLNKHEHCTFQNQNISLKGTDCLQNSFDGILILSDKVEFMSGAA